MKKIMERVRAWVVRVAVLYLGREGFVVMSQHDYAATLTEVAGAAEYVARSGHLNALRDRRPNAVVRLERSFLRMARHLRIWEAS